MNLSLALGIGATAGGSPTAQAELIALLNAAGSTNSFHDYRLATSGPWASADLTANGNNHTSAGPEPTTSATLGAVFDGTALLTQATPGTVTVVMSVIKDPASVNGVIMQTGGGTVLLQYNNGQATLLSGSGTTVDGVAVTNRDQLHDALNDGLEHVLVTRQAFAATDMQIGRSSVSNVGSVRKCAVLNEASLGGDLAAATALAVEAVVA